MDNISDTARFVALNPERYTHDPSLFLAAWITLKQERGEPVFPDRAGQPRHHVETRRAGPRTNKAPK